MKKKPSASASGNSIREIDVSDLLNQLREEPHSDDSAGFPKSRENPKHPAPGVPAKSQVGREVGANATLLHGTTADAKVSSESSKSDQFLPGADVHLNPSIPGGKLSRSKKQKLRLLRKLQERQANTQSLDVQDSDCSDMSANESVNPPSSPEGGSKKGFKQRRNYVERTSSTTGGAGCSWKDMMCVLLVFVAIAAAGLLKFQEEMFGSVERMRLETDSDADYYEILGIPHSASFKEIKRAYRNKVLEVHPDHHPGCSDCQEKFIASTKAYETLVDDEKRIIYDQTRGSYEPILSDHSVSLTTFNYRKLVAESPNVWVIQVFDDLDGNSRYFGTHWDSVAGSDIASLGIKFGRVNARRDKAVLSLLPMRAKMFPTVIMFSRDTMPSIFSLADISSKALRRWIVANVPSHVDESNSYTQYRAIFSGGASDNPPPAVKVASVKYSYIFDVSYERGSGKSRLEIYDKNDNKIIATQTCSSEKDCATMSLEELKRRINIPLNRYNIRSVCQSDDVQIYCVKTKASTRIFDKPNIDRDEILYQPITLSGSSSRDGMVIDMVGSRVQETQEYDFVPFDVDQFIEKQFPLSVTERIRQNAMILSVAAMCVVAVGITSRFSAVQLTIAIAGMSILIGAMNALVSSNLLATLKARLFTS